MSVPKVERKSTKSKPTSAKRSLCKANDTGGQPVRRARKTTAKSNVDATGSSITVFEAHSIELPPASGIRGTTTTASGVQLDSVDICQDVTSNEFSHNVERRKPCADILPAGVTAAVEQAKPSLTLGSFFRKTAQAVNDAWHWIGERRRSQLANKRLCLCETVSLGDKRFLAIVKVDGQHFLVGGAPSSISMLAQLTGKHEFADVLRRHPFSDGMPA